ncbi:hypothetical protein FQR65_LT09703 [Abscondita terminalis]|nr:hypothetical protein FQR65_LT09703 [Abscondita terminalis]
MPEREPEVNILPSKVEKPLTDMTNIIRGPIKGFYATVYSFTSEEKGVAKSRVDEDGDVRVMFYKAVDDTGKLFKLVESDISDVMFTNLLNIVSTPKEVKRGKSVYYEFDRPIEVFEK